MTRDQYPYWTWALFALICVCILLQGCSTVPQVTLVVPPQVLLAPCEEPSASFETNGELAEYALALRGALRLCNADKAALRAWAEGSDLP